MTPHFTLEEFCKSQTAERHGINNLIPTALLPSAKAVAQEVLEPVRDRWGPFIVSSGYRCRELNKVLGSGAASQHCKGEAADFEVPGISNFNLACWIRDNLDFDQLILECYRAGDPNSGWIHCSYKREGNREMVLTYTGGNWRTGLLSAL